MEYLNAPQLAIMIRIFAQALATARRPSVVEHSGHSPIPPMGEPPGLYRLHLSRMNAFSHCLRSQVDLFYLLLGHGFPVLTFCRPSVHFIHQEGSE
jgi:hypothetical protein